MGQILRAACGIALTLSLVGTAQAQDIYGGIDASLGYSDANDRSTEADEWSYGLDVTGYAGTSFGEGLFLEGDLRLQAYDADRPFPETLRDSQTIALRFGKDWGGISAEAIAGYVSAHTREGTSGRGFAALAGTYTLSDRFTATGLVGYLDGTDGTDTNGEDAFRELLHVSVGGNYQLNDRFGLWGSASYGDGIVDADEDAATLAEVGLGIDYAFANPAWKGYMGITYTDYHDAEGDSIYDTRLNVGVLWTFGGPTERTTRERPALPQYGTWLGVSGALLE